MKFKKISFTHILEPTYIPENLTLVPPTNSHLPFNQQHFLLSIPWNEAYLEKVPAQLRTFFLKALPYMNVRTTDVHTAISLSFLDELLSRFTSINQRVVGLALILHDVGWSQLSEQEIASSLGVSGLVLTQSARGPKEKHAVESEKIARKLLKEFKFEEPLSDEELELICTAVRLHDKPWEVAGAGQDMPLEVQVLVDLDHLWSYTQENFWQDTVRKGVDPRHYVQNLEQDLNGYFVTNPGKDLARALLAQRIVEVREFVKIRS